MTDTKPSVSGGRTLMDYLKDEVFYYHGVNVPYFRLLFDTIENMTVPLEKDDKESYLRFMEDAFICVDKYHDESSMRLGVAEIEKLLEDKTVGQAKDRAFSLTIRLLLQNSFRTRQARLSGWKRKPELSSDYAVLHEAMGSISLACGRLDKAKDHLQTAMGIYEQLWAGEPELMEAKYSEIQKQYALTGINIGKQLLS